MTLKLVIVAALVAVHSVTAIPPVEKRSGSVCQSGIYGELAPILAQYPIAQAFCTAVYPVKCTSAGYTQKKRAVTTSSSKTTTPSIVAAVKTTTPSTTKTTPSTTKSTTMSTTSATTTTQDAKASAWSKCQGQPANVISTMCSCIESAKPCPSSSTTTHSTTTATTTASTTSSTTTTPTSTTTSSTTTSSTTTTTTTSSTTSSTTTSSSSSSTTTSTTTTTSAAPTCATCTSGSFPPQDASDCGCTYTISCGMQVLSTSSGRVYTYPAGTATCYTDCVTICDHMESCSVAEFNLVTTECTLYYNGVCAVVTAPNPSYVIGQIQYGSCNSSTECGAGSNSNAGLGTC